VIEFYFSSVLWGIIAIHIFAAEMMKKVFSKRVKFSQKSVCPRSGGTSQMKRT
jgi:hypothetical protein